MAFRFNFAADDSDDDGPAAANGPPSPAAAPPAPAEPPRFHSLADLLPTLPPTLAYSTVALTPTVAVARRELYDVRMQLMAGDGPGGDAAAAVALGGEDVRRGVYEGGLKAWECSVDLARHVAGAAGAPPPPPRHTLELGCGTALPSLVVLRRLLDAPPATGDGALLTCADYNHGVLALATLPNLLLTWAAWADAALPAAGDLAVTPALVAAFEAALRERRIALGFVSGAWGDALLAVLPAPAYALVLASETIYAPATTPPFAHVLTRALLPAGAALVAAKKIYFGVGGSVADFVRLVEAGGWRARVVEELGEGGVGRVVVRVER